MQLRGDESTVILWRRADLVGDNITVQSEEGEWRAINDNKPRKQFMENAKKRKIAHIIDWAGDGNRD